MVLLTKKSHHHYHHHHHSISIRGAFESCIERHLLEFLTKRLLPMLCSPQLPLGSYQKGAQTWIQPKATPPVSAKPDITLILPLLMITQLQLWIVKILASTDPVQSPFPSRPARRQLNFHSTAKTLTIQQVPERRGHMLQLDLIFHWNWINNQSSFLILPQIEILFIKLMASVTLQSVNIRCVIYASGHGIAYTRYTPLLESIIHTFGTGLYWSKYELVLLFSRAVVASVPKQSFA